MKGGIVLFRGTGAAARRYVEADRSGADEYYLGADHTVAQWTTVDATGAVTAGRSLSADGYEGWVNWVHPVTGEQMGTPRHPGEGRRGSPMFAEMVVNAPKSLSIAAALHPEVSEVLDAAQRDAVGEIRRWLGEHSVTRLGPRGAQEIVPVEQMQVVGIVHRTSRAGDPHRHVHLQIGTRVWAAGAWRGLDTAALFKQQGAIRALGTAVIAAHPHLADTLARLGLTLDPVTGEVAELEEFNPLMSKRAAQIRRNLARIETDWDQAHPGQTPGPVLTGRMQAQAWAHERPGKKPADLRDEAWWIQELRDAGYDPATVHHLPTPTPVGIDDLSIRRVANRALDRCAASASTWTAHTITEHVTRIITEAGVRATGEELREFINLATRLAGSDCLSVLPAGVPAPEHVAHWTSLRVIEADITLRDLLSAHIPERGPAYPDVKGLAAEHGLDQDQARAATAVASTDPLVVVEGAAGAGKTTMLGVAIQGARAQGRATRVVAPTLRAAQVAEEELGVPAASAAALVYAHGWRWNQDGAWTRLAAGDIDPDTGGLYPGPPGLAMLAPGERVVVDEAGMLDQDTAIALLTVTGEAGARVALVGDRAQLPAVGRGGLLDIAAQIRGRTWDMTEVHRFTDPTYASLTIQMRDGTDPGGVFDQLAALGLVRIHPDGDAMEEQIAAETRPGEAVTVATNDQATVLNGRIHTIRVHHGQVDDTATVTGADGLSIGAGDLIQTRRNDSRLGVANRQTWTVQHVADDGTVHAYQTGSGRHRPRTVVLPAHYVAEHTHLAYAATAYGVQGATVAGSHTVLSDQTSAASVYVGMTRGRTVNLLHVVAEDLADARQQFVAATGRDRADRGLDHATTTARDAVRGLVATGPAALVNTEIARLVEEAEQAECQAVAWEQIAERFDAQRAAHQAETAEATTVLRHAREEAARVRTEVAVPLTEKAERDGAAYLATVEAEVTANARLATVGWFGRRKARDVHRTVAGQMQVARAHVRQVWEAEPPRTPETLSAWAGRVAGRRAESDPRVSDATQAVEAADTGRAAMRQRHRSERLALLAREYGAENARAHQHGMHGVNPRRTAQNLRACAALLRAEIDELRTLTAVDAATHIQAKRAGQERAQQQTVQRQRQLARFEYGHRRADPRCDGPPLGL